MTGQTTTMRTASEVRFNRFLALVYLTMAFGLGITALVSSWTTSNEDLMRRILQRLHAEERREA